MASHDYRYQHLSKTHVTMQTIKSLLTLVVMLTASAAAASESTQEAESFLPHLAKSPQAPLSQAYRWLDVILEASARDVERIGARPTILSRQMQIPLNAMYDAWACYDGKAIGTMFGGDLRRPAAERTLKNKQAAIAYAIFRTTVDVLPHHEDYLVKQMQAAGYDPNDESQDLSTPVGIGNYIAAEMLAMRHRDGANQLGDEIGGTPGVAYSDYTMYRPVNPTDKVYDPDRWQPLPFTDKEGKQFYPGFLTPHWYRVKPFALASCDQFRPGPPPRVGSKQLEEEVAECVRVNAELTPEQKAVVEFMRDGPRSTAQSGHWLRFAQDVSRRDKHNLDSDVKLFFCVANCAFDCFISCWDTKRYYDTSRPMTLIRHVYYADQEIVSWAGPGKGVARRPGSAWLPYSPAQFITPPFPGYTSGHATVSGGCAEMLRLFTGNDHFGVIEQRLAGELTEEGFACDEMQARDGAPLPMGEHATCEVALRLPTFTETAEMAAESRLLGGYHIRTDNEVGLKKGREIANYMWPVIQAYFNGVVPSAG